ncbi:MAG: hypothetical protein ABL984_03635, partial [Pyrinomonadaceae bacterium]
DNNRDWYAFTQVETQLTVDKIHNVWHPQIVHDIHQQGSNGSRLFLPPYMRPVEPNVPKQIVEGYTELGNYMAKSLRDKGFAGITTNSTYDAWTPARAYSHYHGGVRILSETASAKLATPITVKWEDIRASSDDGYDPRVESANFGPVWKGGEWKLRNITNYMTNAAFSLLDHAANNRTQWLSRFFEIGKEAVRPRKEGEPKGFVFSGKRTLNVLALQDILKRGGVHSRRVRESQKWADTEIFVPIEQPYGSFAKALLEPQTYPDLLDSSGHPIAPYDVTAHTMPLLMDLTVRPILKSTPIAFEDNEVPLYGSPVRDCTKVFEYGIYSSAIPSMDEGWTKWIFKDFDWMIPAGDYPCAENKHTLTEIDDKVARTLPNDKVNVLIFPDQSAAQILNGHRKGSMPDEYTGGVGKEGVENLKKFVEAGGTLVFLNRASNFAIEQFNLPVKDVTKGLTRKELYIPGSILRTQLDLTHPIAKGMPQQSIAWFENSPAFEIQTDPLAAGVGSPTVREGAPNTSGALANARATDTAGLTRNFRIIASYPKDPKQILLSGWALGAEKIAGKAALVEFTVGKGKIVLFGFRPQYRSQSLATFPLLFNSISQ